MCVYMCGVCRYCRLKMREAATLRCLENPQALNPDAWDAEFEMQVCLTACLLFAVCCLLLAAAVCESSLLPQQHAHDCVPTAYASCLAGAAAAS